MLEDIVVNCIDVENVVSSSINSPLPFSSLVVEVKVLTLVVGTVTILGEVDCIELVFSTFSDNRVAVEVVEVDVTDEVVLEIWSSISQN